MIMHLKDRHLCLSFLQASKQVLTRECMFDIIGMVLPKRWRLALLTIDRIHPVIWRNHTREILRKGLMQDDCIGVRCITNVGLNNVCSGI